MTDNTQQSSGATNVDGFSDTTGNNANAPDSADYGTEGRKKPMSEEERMQAEREIEQKGDSNRLQEQKHEK
jgi:hypothetical protein